MHHTHEFTPDPSREDRCGFPEVIYAEGKTPQQVVDIALDLLEQSDVVLATRANAEHASQMLAWFGEELRWFEDSGLLVVDRREGGIGKASKLDGTEPSLDAILAGEAGGAGSVLVCCAGTSDLPVAEEALLTARIMGSRAKLLADVGVAGVHRILEHEGLLREARAIIVVAGMEGALPTLVAGLVDVPVIAVPTSVGYGASFGGISALLGMLTSCAGGVSVVNIDNGFGAGQIADRINRPPTRFSEGAAQTSGDDFPTHSIDSSGLDVPSPAVTGKVASWRDESSSVAGETRVLDPIDPSLFGGGGVPLQDDDLFEDEVRPQGNNPFDEASEAWPYTDE